ncbi:alpha/beta hydrolase [Roseomonas sp. BN140053]|uniref:alpha/beta hydrolase n=1 Tax=Roseomonas sp. BN140053 TaxID=3391898 RepID=UPI0039EB00A9
MRIEDVAFGHHAAAPLLARIYRPEGEGPFPAVVSVHGGAWTFGDRLMNEPLDRALAENGILVMAVDFRMPPEAPYPASVQDVQLAVRWLKRHGAAHGARTDGIGALGTSSGGHQAMLAALRPNHPSLPPLALDEGEALDASLAWVVVGWGVLDPLGRYRMARERGMEKTLDAHHAWWPDEAAMEDASPQHILDRGEAGALPPVLLLQGTADGNLTPDMAQRFAESYRRAGGDAELRCFEGQGHAFVTSDPESEASRAAVAAAVRFIHEQVRSALP